MPELPEVETLRRSLAPVKNLRIESLRISRLCPVETTTPARVRRELTAATLLGWERWGKYLIMPTDREVSLVLHLGMSGQVRFFEKEPPPSPKHTHLELRLINGGLIRFVDPRRFGTISLSWGKGHRGNPFLARLGPDYLDKKLTPEAFVERCRRHPKISLKSMTLNQGIATGLGNIYACEALYGAELNPQRLLGQTPDHALAKFLEQARAALAEGIARGGVSMRDYFNGLGHRGVMKAFLRVYDREGLPALDGRGIVRRIVQNARSTFFVPEVQR
jgi:formamidopyrimidine-DNA glycosylase